MSNAPTSSNPVSIFRTGKLFMEGWYSAEREWVDADEYRQLQRMHKQMCEIAIDRHGQIERLRAALERIKRQQPGPDLVWDICNEALRDADETSTEQP